MLLLLLLLLLLRLIDLVSGCAADAAAVLAAAAAVVAAVPDAGQGFIHPYQLYFPCSGGRDSEVSCLFSDFFHETFCSGW